MSLTTIRDSFTSFQWLSFPFLNAFYFFFFSYFPDQNPQYTVKIAVAKADVLVLFFILGEKAYNVSLLNMMLACKFLIDALCNIESLLLLFCWVFYHWRALDFCQVLFLCLFRRLCVLFPFILLICVALVWTSLIFLR